MNTVVGIQGLRTDVSDDKVCWCHEQCHNSRATAVMALLQPW